MRCTTLCLLALGSSFLCNDGLCFMGAHAAPLISPHTSVVPGTGIARQAQGGRRALLQDEKESEEICDRQCVTVVYSANAFETAVKAGASFIEIREHLNLTDFDTTLYIESSTKTIRGNCDAPVPDVDIPAGHAPLHPLEKHQCLLFTNQNLISVNSSNLWIDNLYVRFTILGEISFSHLFEVRGVGGNLWTTNTTLQGNGDGFRDCWACGIYTWEAAKSYTEDTKIIDFDGFNSAVSWKGFGNFVRCTFANNTLHPSEYGAALIEADVEDEVGGESAMRLEQCTFQNNTPLAATIPTFLTDNRAVSQNQAVIYSDDTSEQVCNIDLQLSTSDSQEDTDTGTSDGDGDGVSVSFVAVASIAGSLLLLASALFASFIIFARRQKSDDSSVPIERGKSDMKKERSLQSTLSASSRGNSSMHASLSIKGNKLPSLRANELSRSTFSMTSSQHPTSVTGTYGPTNAMTKMQQPGPGADTRERKAFLEYQLDTLRGQVVLNRLTILDSVSNRRRGGQAVIQVVEDSRTRVEYAMKFYLSKQGFIDERTLYEDPNQPLGQFLPEVHSIVDSGEAGFVDADGNDLPPCIIMEKGESLDLWAASTGDGLDMVTGLQVMTHLAERLKDLHEAGYVHRDIKPGNVLWLPRKKRWTLIDFGCVARIGEDARTGFTLTYAAPEVITSHRAGERSLVANEALDSWSVGILAVEIFTGQPVFDVFESRENIEAMILGEKTAPWEDEDNALSLAKRFGHLKGPILALLNRDPVDRPSMIELLYACKRVLSHTTTAADTVPTSGGDVKAGQVAAPESVPAAATTVAIVSSETDLTATTVRPQGLVSALPVTSGRTQLGPDLTEADTHIQESPDVESNVPHPSSDSDFLPFSSPPVAMGKEETPPAK